MTNSDITMKCGAMKIFKYGMFNPYTTIDLIGNNSIAIYLFDEKNKKVNVFESHPRYIQSEITTEEIS